MSHVEPLANFLRTQSRTWLFIEALALAIIIGFIDYLTGYNRTRPPELSSFALFLTRNELVDP